MKKTLLIMLILVSCGKNASLETDPSYTDNRGIQTQNDTSWKLVFNKTQFPSDAQVIIDNRAVLDECDNLDDITTIDRANSEVSIQTPAIMPSNFSRVEVRNCKTNELFFFDSAIQASPITPGVVQANICS